MYHLYKNLLRLTEKNPGFYCIGQDLLKKIQKPHRMDDKDLMRHLNVNHLDRKISALQFKN